MTRRESLLRPILDRAASEHLLPFGDNNRDDKTEVEEGSIAKRFVEIDRFIQGYRRSSLKNQKMPCLDDMKREVRELERKRMRIRNMSMPLSISKMKKFKEKIIEEEQEEDEHCKFTFKRQQPLNVIKISPKKLKRHKNTLSIPNISKTPAFADSVKVKALPKSPVKPPRLLTNRDFLEQLDKNFKKNSNQTQSNTQNLNHRYGASLDINKLQEELKMMNLKVLSKHKNMATSRKKLAPLKPRHCKYASEVGSPADKPN